MNLTLNSGQGFARVKVEKVTGRKILAGFILRFELSFTVFPLGIRHTRMIDYEAELRIRGKSSLEEVGKLFKSNPQDIVESFSEQREICCALEIELSRQKMDALEQTRYSGDMVFELNLIGQIHHNNEISNVNQEFRHTVPQSDWVQMLSKMEYSYINLIEIPNLQINSSKHAQKIIDHLNTANHLALEGRFEQSVAQCRFFFENLSKLIGDEEKMRSLNKKTKESTKSERMQLIRKAVADLVHLTHHDDDEMAHVEWHREDALALIGYCTTILQHYFSK